MIRTDRLLNVRTDALCVGQTQRATRKQLLIVLTINRCQCCKVVNLCSRESIIHQLLFGNQQDNIEINKLTICIKCDISVVLFEDRI